jgi:hypothetical protein
MTHARIHRQAIGILGIVVALALSITISTTPVRARTFNFNSAGSMVQQALSPQFACALAGRSFACPDPQAAKRSRPR